MRAVFPLRNDFFPRFSLTPAQEARYRDTAHAIFCETLDECSLHEAQGALVDTQTTWKQLRQREHLTVFRRRHPASFGTHATNVSDFLCVGKLEGTLDQVMCGHYADSTETMRRMNAVARADLVDCHVLHTIETQSDSKPFCFLGFKWMTVASPTPTPFARNRDMCWLESMGLTTDTHGREIGYVVANSVDLKACPPFDSSICVRMKLFSCYIFRQNETGGVDVFMRASAQWNSDLPSYVADRRGAALWLDVQHATKATYAMLGSTLLRASTPNNGQDFLNTRQRCEICNDKTSGLLTKTLECGVCRRVICSRCILPLRVLSPGPDFLTPRRASFCKRCVACFHDVNLRDLGSMDEIAEIAAREGDPLAIPSTRNRPNSCKSAPSARSSGRRYMWSPCHAEASPEMPIATRPKAFTTPRARSAAGTPTAKTSSIGSLTPTTVSSCRSQPELVR